MTSQSLGAEAEAVAFGDPVPPSKAQSAQRAFSVTTTPPLPAVLPRVSHARGVFSRVHSGAYVTSQLPSLKAGRERIHEHAAKFDGTFLKALRLLWGYCIYQPVKAVLNAVEWVIECPSIAIPLALIALAAYFLH